MTFRGNLLLYTLWYELHPFENLRRKGHHCHGLTHLSWAERKIFYRVLGKKFCGLFIYPGQVSSFRSPLGPPFDFLFDTCSCQTARCFNKSKGVLITGLKLKAFRNPQPSWGFSVHKKARLNRRAVITLCYLANQNL